MPYFIYEISGAGKQLKQIESHPAFRDAKIRVRHLRTELRPETKQMIRIIFAETTEQAEAYLREKRTVPILKEWEK